MRTHNLDASAMILCGPMQEQGEGGLLRASAVQTAGNLPAWRGSRELCCDGREGIQVDDLTASPHYPDTPSGSEELTSFEWHSNWADNYGTRLRGYVHPPVSDWYRFWIAGDDQSELWLSSDDDPANKKMIASVPEWSPPRVWTQGSAWIRLEAGRRYYYIEALHKEGGGDNLAVRWRVPGIIWEDAANPDLPNPGYRLSPFGAPLTGHITEARSHVYADNGTCTVTLTVADDDGGSHTVQTTVTVRNRAPNVAPLLGPASAVPGQPLAYSTIFSDAGFDNPTRFRERPRRIVAQPRH